jgi:hypothetical protein
MFLGWHLQEVPVAGVAEVRDVDEHPEPVELLHGLDPELGETPAGSVVRDAVGELVPEAVDEAHHPHPEAVEDPEHPDLPFDDVGPLDGEHSRHPPFLVSLQDAAVGSDGSDRLLMFLAFAVEDVDHLHRGA